MEHPNPKQHQRISFLKSALRLIGYLLLLVEPVAAITILVCSEGLGIVEELV
jgi:hypothetical protein